MKLTTIALGVIAGSALAYNAYSLTCAQQPTCDSLGYTLTSTTDCIGTVLKCPFNTARYYCTKKAELVQNLVLDWNKKKSFNPVSSTYYVNDYGIVIGRVQDITKVGGQVQINGNVMSLTGAENMYTFFYSQVSPGDRVSAGGRDPIFYFVPYKK